MRKVTKEKSIATLFPNLLIERDYIKNKDIASPTEVLKGSHLKVWWVCTNRSFIRKIYKR